MQSRPDQGALLTLLGADARARAWRSRSARSPGYGAICIARGLAEGGRLTCFEVSEEYAEIARRNVERGGPRRPGDDRGRARRTQALERIPEVPQIDLAYVDADKGGYPGYYDALVPRLRPGGVLVLDNTLLGERVLDPATSAARTMNALNERIAADERVESVLLGLSDGVTLPQAVS